MLEKLMSNPYAWAILSVCTIGSMVFAVYTWIKGKERKEFSYTYVSNAIIRGGEKQNSAIKVTYNGFEVKDLTSTKIAIWNSGNRVLNKSDIVTGKELTIFVGEGKEILSVEIVAQSDDTNKFILTQSADNEQSISFEYADTQEGVVLQVFHTGYNDDIFVDVKIKGGKPIKVIYPLTEYEKKKTINKEKAYAVAYGLFSAFMSICGIFAITSIWNPATMEWIHSMMYQQDTVETVSVLEKITMSILFPVAIFSTSMDGVVKIKKAFKLTIPSALRKYM